MQEGRAREKDLYRGFWRIIVFMVVAAGVSASKGGEKVFPGADERTLSLAQYFSWINNTNEGSTEEQTLINLDFFKWLHDEYGMKLDIYAFDAGNIDGPGYYGHTVTEKFKKQFPNGFDTSYNKAKSFGCRLGVWLGPDGFGDTPETEQTRIDMLVGFCRDYEFALFKMDAVCGQLRGEKQGAFIRLMKECRKYRPELILLNHRLRLGEATPYATTFLWGGAETYIDVHMANWSRTGTHNRVRAISRGLVPELKRLTEDCGVCLSSCLDYWEDDLILQAFNRSLILAPEIYANPWFLRDDEFPKLARIYNLHRRYRDILVKGLVLDEDRYGPYAVSRGDEHTRLITLRNLTWTPVTYNIKLDETIALKASGLVNVRQLHPTEKILGRVGVGQEVAVKVLPFRSCLILASTESVDEIGINGCAYEVVRDTPGKDAIVRLLGPPGTKATISLSSGNRSFTKAALDGKDLPSLIRGRKVKIAFPGKPMKYAWHRKLGVPRPCAVPPDAEALYEATCFAANNNALEVRSLMRSGPTKIAQVKRARDAFFNQALFTERGIWDKSLFDGDMETRFGIRGYSPQHGGAFRIDFGEPIGIDKLVIRGEGTDISAGYASIPSSNLFSVDGNTGGLTGEYFEGTDLKKSVLKKLDPKIDFNWTGAPHNKMSRDQFSVRWTGQIRTTDKSGIYSFVTHSDDGVRLWVDKKLIIDDWTHQSRKRNTGEITLQAGTRYDIRIEFFESGGAAIISLVWSEPHESLAQVSSDLRSWLGVPIRKDKDALVVEIPVGKAVKFLRIKGIPSVAAEVEGYSNGVALDRSGWRASNLFEHYSVTPAVAARSLSFRLEEAAKGSYIAVALNGRHGNEGAYVALRIGDRLVGAQRRAPSYPANVWEYPVVRHDRNYTYFVSVTKDMVDKDIEAVVLGLDEKNLDFKPEVWITAYPIPFEARELVLTR